MRRASERQAAASRKGGKSGKSGKRKSGAKRWLVVGGIGLIGLITLLSLILPYLPMPNPTAPTTAGPGTLLPDLGQTHIPQAQSMPVSYYNSIPPTSGNHWGPVWAKCGIIDTQVPNEAQVHNLEHGYVVIQYNPSKIDQATIDQLKATVKKLPGWSDFYIVAPYADMTSPIALTAWRHIQTLDTVDETVMRAFADAYRVRGPENVTNPGAIKGCDGTWQG